jgi:hypothetical protein
MDAFWERQATYTVSSVSSAVNYVSVFTTYPDVAGRSPRKTYASRLSRLIRTVLPTRHFPLEIIIRKRRR